MAYPLTWTCMVCGDTRPDALIAVAHRPIEGLEQYFPDSVCNVRHCTDRPACVADATAPGVWTATRHRRDTTAPPA
jgi:hypothetical protein